MSQSSQDDNRPVSAYKHPRGLPVLFFSEMWERFSYYGMKALLTLYMTKALRYGDKRAYDVYGGYTALIYATPVVGGRVADGFLGYRWAIILGAVLMVFGHFFMAIEHLAFFFGALALISLGNGYFKANMSTLVGKLYRDNDPRRDAGFTIFYMGINAGAFLGPLICPVLSGRWGWHYGFTAAGFGMLGGLFGLLRGDNASQERAQCPSECGFTLLFSRE